MRKHIFETSNIFCIKKKRSKHVRVLAVCNTQEYVFWYICIFVTLRRKPGILNTRFLFLQYKKKNTKKINTHALPAYCSSELNFTWTVTNATKNACKKTAYCPIFFV
jgi:hypothetical protein